MAATDRMPETQNFLSPLGFRFVLSRSPEINYFVQNVTLPDMSIGAATMPTPFTRVPLPGDKVTFGDLSITFKVDENMVNFQHIYDWIAGLAKLDSFNQYTALQAGSSTGAGIVCDATLVVLTSAKNPNKQISFTNIFPTSLSGLTFDTTSGDVSYLQATVTFAIQKYQIIEA